MGGIVRRVEQLVEHVIARCDRTRGQQRQRQRARDAPRRHLRHVEEGEGDAEQHERVLEPVIDARDLHVRPEGGEYLTRPESAHLRLVEFSQRHDGRGRHDRDG
jgi:hypothetical protein